MFGVLGFGVFFGGGLGFGFWVWWLDFQGSSVGWLGRDFRLYAAGLEV